MKKVKSPEQALSALRFMCSKMERTEQDARRSLMRWSVEQEQWQAIIELLKRDGFINHSRYAACYVRDKVSNSTWGERKIVQALRTKGIEKEFVEQAMEQANHNQMNDRLLEQMDRKAQQLRGRKLKNSYELRTKLFAWAASRGYDFDQINAVIGKVLTSSEGQEYEEV